VFHNLALLVITIILGFNSVAHAAPVLLLNEDVNPYVEKHVPSSQLKKVKGYIISKPLMTWENGYLYSSRTEDEKGTWFKLSYANCHFKRSRVLYTTRIEENGGFSNYSMDVDNPYLSVEKSQISIGQYCSGPQPEVLNLQNLPKVVGASNSELRYKVLQRNFDTVKVLTYKTLQYNGHSHYSIMRYDCKTQADMEIFHVQTTPVGEVVEYHAPTQPTWNSVISGDDQARNKRYENMINTFCSSK
jgi:hypothetical protein